MTLPSKKSNFKKLFRYISEKKIHNSIAKLKSVDLKNFDFNRIKDLLLPLIQCGFVIIRFPKERPIFRGRPVNLDEIKDIKNTSQISYPPKEYLLKYNRASSDRDPIFYGCISNILKQTEIGLTGISFEASNLLTDKNLKDSEYFAFGRWCPSEDLTVAVVGLNSPLSKNNSDIQSMLQFQNSIFKDINIKLESIQLAQEFLGTEFSKKVKNEFEYKISAAYSELIFDLGFDAVLFPSVANRGYVSNIAIHNEIVDKFLFCDAAAIRRDRKIAKKEVISDYFLVCGKVGKDKIIRWSEPPLSSVFSNVELKQIEREVKMHGKLISRNLLIDD